jgi:hypothetical protein
MFRNILLALASIGTALAILVAAPVASPARGGKADIDWNAVGQALGIPATAQAGGVYRIDIPRTDLHVTLPLTDVATTHGSTGSHNPHSPTPTTHGSIHVKPAFALGGYLVFLPTGTGRQVMMMGDLVLTEDEIEPVMLALEQGGVDVAAIHNHLLWEKPTVMYMHVMVMGDAVKLATAVHNALALTPTPLTAQAPNPADQQVDLDTAALDQVIGTTGKVGGGVYKYSIAPTYTITSMGLTIPPSMGMSTSLAFQPLGNGHAAVTGDFALRGNQVNPVIRALRTNGIFVTALHSHMLDATPTVFFMHFYATGDAIALAKGLRAGLDAITANPPM